MDKLNVDLFQNSAEVRLLFVTVYCHLHCVPQFLSIYFKQTPYVFDLQQGNHVNCLPVNSLLT